MLANHNAIEGESNYVIERSLRFSAASSQYLSRTLGSASTSTTTCTWSIRLKRGALDSSTARHIIAYNGNSGGTGNMLLAEFYQDTIRVLLDGGATTGGQTANLFRDPSAHSHLIIYYDSTQATASDRFKIYVDGKLATFSSVTYPALNQAINAGVGNIQSMGNVPGQPLYLDAYLSEVHFIDGQALTPSYFGQTNIETGQWVAKKYTGTYGTNGFYLDFKDGTSITTLGYDKSGNANNWTLTNFTRSAGVNDCWMLDVPSGNGSSAGVQPSGNYAVGNSLVNTGYSLLNGNLRVSTTGSGAAPSPATIAVTSGSWYWEVSVTVGISANAADIGIIDTRTNTVLGVGGNPLGYSYYGYNGNTLHNSSSGVAYGASYTIGDIIGIAFDADAGSLTFYKNNISQGVAFTSIPQAAYYPAVAKYTGTSGGSLDWNFGQRSFAYTPPTGFKALCTANLPTPAIVKGNEYMDVTTYSGNSSTQNIVNAAGFSPDLVWIKSRSGALAHYLSDTIRGAYKLLFSNLTNAEFDATSGSDGVSAFNSNGFTLLNGTNVANYNQSGSTYVAWQWNAGSSTVTNTSGTISSQVRANPTAGFSIVTYTGTGANGTVGHGLGVAPKMVIVKNRGGTAYWPVYHINANATPQNGFLYLNDTPGFQVYALYWNNTAPTLSVISVGTDVAVNTNGNGYVAYCFTEIAGYSKFGSYTGNGSADGPFVYCGFRPKYVLIKQTSGMSDWWIWDTTRETYNQMSSPLFPNATSVEASNAVYQFDILSNGFKMRNNNATVNGSGLNYIYAAFAESPFQYANAR